MVATTTVGLRADDDAGDENAKEYRVNWQTCS